VYFRSILIFIWLDYNQQPNANGYQIKSTDLHPKSRLYFQLVRFFKSDLGPVSDDFKSHHSRSRTRLNKIRTRILSMYNQSILTGLLYDDHNHDVLETLHFRRRSKVKSAFDKTCSNPIHYRILIFHSINIDRARPGEQTNNPIKTLWTTITILHISDNQNCAIPTIVSKTCNGSLEGAEGIDALRLGWVWLNFRFFNVCHCHMAQVSVAPVVDAPWRLLDMLGFGLWD